MSKCVVNYIFLFSLLFSSIALKAQNTEETPKRYLNLILGGGAGLYFNNMQTVPNGGLNPVIPNASLKVYWQTEYRLKLGLETGYYPFYKAHAIEIDGIRYDEGSSTLTVVPIFFNVDMRVVDNFHLSIGTGFADMIYTVKEIGPQVSGSQMSLANFSLSAAYYWPLSKKFDLGAELKYLKIGKTEDDHLSLQISLSYRVCEWAKKKKKR